MKRGFGLIEVLISLVLAVLIATALVKFAAQYAKSITVQLQATELQTAIASAQFGALGKWNETSSNSEMTTSISHQTWEFIDSNHDGINDKWVLALQLAGKFQGRGNPIYIAQKIEVTTKSAQPVFAGTTVQSLQPNFRSSP